MDYGKQVGVFVYGRGINVRAYASAARAAGFVVVFRDGFATLHEED